MRNLLLNKKGQGLAEYGLIVMGVAIVSLGALSVFGHNVGDLFATAAAIIPGSEPIYDQPVYVGELIELSVPDPIDGTGINLNIGAISTAINDATPTYRLDVNITNNEWTVAWEALVFENF
ncbi:MAG: hypothetical protein SF028_05335 [Candidatus Sumerlaeia bacterium]|nr:hypothetical protein [Candidatus Sumerlaeia bacterium]